MVDVSTCYFALFAKEYSFYHHSSNPQFSLGKGTIVSDVKTTKILGQADLCVAPMTQRPSPHLATCVSSLCDVDGKTTLDNGSAHLSTTLDTKRVHRFALLARM